MDKINRRARQRKRGTVNDDKTESLAGWILYRLDCARAVRYPDATTIEQRDEQIRRAKQVATEAIRTFRG